MNLERRIKAFTSLGEYLKNLPNEELENLYLDAKRNNAWFTEFSVRFALSGITNFLEESELRNWLSSYTFKPDITPKRVGVVMAGNIPLVGFHDFLSILISGNGIVAKLSSIDNVLIK